MSKPTTATATPVESIYLTFEGAHILTGAPIETLRSWCKQGRLRKYRPGRLVLLKRSELLAFIEASAHV